MFKQLILFSIGLSLGVTAYTQNEMPVILVYSKGKINYRSPAKAEQQPVVPGAVLNRNGVISLKKKSQAVVFCEGQFRQIQGKEPVSLAEQFPKSGGTVKLGFDLAFGEHLLAAVSMAAYPGNPRDAWGSVKTASGTGDGWGGLKTVSGTGDGWGGVKTASGTGDGWGTVKTTTGTGDGWGGKGQKIIAILPFGKISGASATLSWSRPSGEQTFLVSITDHLGKTVVETTTRDTFWLLDLTQAKLTPGANYQWSVAAQGNKDMTSNTLSFEMTDGAATTAAIRKAEDSELYKKNPEALRGLMRAVALEQQEMYVAAAQTYQELQKTNPRNPLIRLMHAAFWMRYGLKPVAEEVYKS